LAVDRGGGNVAKTRLSRREREVMEIVHRAGPVSAADIRTTMEDPPTDGAVRSTLRILVDKGHLSYEADGPRYLYFPTVASQDAGRSALDRLMHTFFDGSPESVMAALLEVRGQLTPEEKRRLRDLIDRAEEEGR
jgi:predicted transcriptional regulator